MRSEAGFTLLELMVTLTLASLLSVLLFGGLRLGARAWDRSEARGAGTDELGTVQALLRREIEEAYPLYLTTDPLHPAIDFAGDPDSMTFLAPAPQAAALQGRTRITLATEHDVGGMHLVMTATPELAASAAAAWHETLIGRLAGLRFAYYGSDDPQTAPSWHAHWTNARMLPELVRVDAMFPRGDGRVWPVLVIAPRITADADCVYDITTTRCMGRS